MAAESGKIDPMHQFEVTPLGGGFHLGGHEILFTNSALWMVVAAITLGIFMWGGMRRQLVPGRWQAAVESFTGFISSMMTQNIGSEGRKFTPYVFSLFMFILFCNLLGMLPLGVFGIHPFTVTSHIAITGVLALVSFAIVLVVGFWRHGLHFFSLFVPHGTPLPMIPIIARKLRALPDNKKPITMPTMPSGTVARMTSGLRTSFKMMARIAKIAKTAKSPAWPNEAMDSLVSSLSPRSTIA